MARHDLGAGLLEHLGLGAEDEHAKAATLGEREQLLHEVDAGHALGQRVAQQARSPHHRLTVGGDQLARLDDAAQLGIALHRDELGGVDGHVLRELARGR